MPLGRRPGGGQPRHRDVPATAPEQGSFFEVLRVFLRLGLTSFGGPVAHLGYYRAELVERRKWLDERSYADIVALCQFLPGPASSQTGISLGILRAGLPGGLAAWLGFTMPSAVAMILFAYGVAAFGDIAGAAWLHGLKIVAVAVVAQAVWGMARNLCPDRERATIAVAATVATLALPSSVGQIGAILLGGLAGWALPAAGQPRLSGAPLAVHLPRGLSIAAALLFVGLLFGLPLLAALVPSHALQLFASFYRSGALVFGGGHVVLPLLQAAVVPPHWVTNDTFLAGYGAAQAVPGPLFTFSAYLGAVMREPPNGWAGGFLCLVAVFLPSFLLLIGILPFWDGLRRRTAVVKALRGVNAAVVGLLLAALYRPVWTSAILAPADFAIGVVAFLLLALWAAPPWLVVILGALGAGLAALVPGLAASL
ncbi:MAG TPA: chromate efflux transporter [Stellaceae bacterium]|nr:chromate efflux transporter [Stellaceae bacterium]